MRLEVLILKAFILVLIKNGTKIHGKNLKNIDARIYASDYYGKNLNKYKVKTRTWLRFWENKGWIYKIDLYGWFQSYFRYWLGRRSRDDERQINKWKKNVGRFTGKWVRMIRDAGSKFDDYSISPKTRQILLNWGFELTEKDYF